MIGILALQGDFDAHRRAMARLGVESREVVTAQEIDAVDGLILPGGESTTMWKLMEGTGIEDAIQRVASSGRPILGTCAGAILLASNVTNPAQRSLSLLPATIVRNAYGRQLDSTVVMLDDVSPRLGGGPLEAVFIRAPRFSEVGPDVEVLARRDGDPVLVRRGNVCAATFHPELTRDDRVLDLVFREGRGAADRRAA